MAEDAEDAAVIVEAIVVEMDCVRHAIWLLCASVNCCLISISDHAKVSSKGVAQKRSTIAKPSGSYGSLNQIISIHAKADALTPAVTGAPQRFDLNWAYAAARKMTPNKPNRETAE